MSGVDSWILKEIASNEVFPPSEHNKAKTFVSSMSEYQAKYAASIEDPDKFWQDVIAELKLHFHEPPQTIHSSNYNAANGKVYTEWFKGAKTNLCYNALDKHVKEGRGDKICFLWEGNEPSESATFTYAQMLDLVVKFAGFLKSAGVQKGDRVALYMPMIVELPAAMLACARIGAIHSVVFGGFSAESLASRLVDCQPKILITADGSFRGPKLIELKSISDDALSRSAAQGVTVPQCVVVHHLKERYNGKAFTMVEGRDIWFEDAIAKSDGNAPVEWMDAEDPLFMLYTSGSTGKPKGVVHTQAGYMVWTALTFKYTFDYHQDDIYWCTADLGWITGHSYILYGPLINCATSVLFEGVPNHPDAGRCWQVCEKHKVNQFYTAPTAIRALMRSGEEPVNRYDLSSLRVLGSVGEPINPEAWRWYHSVVGKGRCSISDTWWQTETGGHMITSLPGATVEKPGSASFPFFGVVPVIVDNQGQEVVGAGSGHLVIKQSWPGQARTIYGDHERFVDVYFSKFPGYYVTGDGCRRDADGYFWITGRTDDVMMVSGHRIGTAEIESALGQHPAVTESAVVGYPHDIKGEGIYVFVILAEGVVLTPALETELKNTVRKVVGPFAQPDKIQHAAKGLPKTRSGKIMRRILRKIVHKETDQLGDLSTLSDPHCVEDLIAHAK